MVVLSKADLCPDPAGAVLDVRVALGGTVPVLAISASTAPGSTRSAPGCSRAAPPS